jgi:DNA-binding SARP family transcriptional activator
LAVEFRLLGPLEVVDGTRRVTIAAPKQRALLAFLLLQRDETVPVARLADALWEDQPPVTATKAIQVYVAQLRKVLGDGLLVTEPGGYAAVLNGHELDIDRFERLIEQGQRHLDAGEPEHATRALAEALRLWHGPPLADLPHTHAIRDHVARLEEQHVRALECRIDADLALDRHQRLVPELQELVSRHPLRERLRAQLMLALYGAAIAFPAAQALERLGTPPTGVAAYDYQRGRYGRLAARVGRSRVDVVILCGLIDTDAGAVLAALRRLEVPIIGCEGLLPLTLLFDSAGRAAAGTYITISGLVNERLPAAGREFVREFGADQGGAPVTASAVYAAQATELMLAAVARSDGTRESVRRAVTSARVQDALIGSLAIDANGDPDPALVSVVRARRRGTDLSVLAYDGAEVLDPIAPPRELWGGP